MISIFVPRNLKLNVNISLRKEQNICSLFRKNVKDEKITMFLCENIHLINFVRITYIHLYNLKNTWNISIKINILFWSLKKLSKININTAFWK